MKLKILFLALLVSGFSWGQYSITGIGAGNTYTQNFNTFAGTAGTVPANWAWTNSDYTPGGYYNRTGAYSNTNSTYALRESASPGTDIAFGAKNDGATYTLTFNVVNNTGADINGFEIGWNVEQYSAAANATPVSFSYRLAAAAFGLTNATGTGTTAVNASTLGTAANLGSITVTARAISITSITLANGQTADFRITIGNGAANNAHIGVDDFTIYATAVPVTPCSTPTSQASSIANTNTTVGGTDISWTPGATASGSLVVIRPSASADAPPVNGTNYTPTTAWGTAAQIDTNNRVFYRGNGSSVTGITGLTPETPYTITVYSYNGSGTNICYNTASAETLFFVTMAAEPTGHAASFSCLTASATQINLTFSAANTIGGDGYIIMYRVGAAPTGFPPDGALPTQGDIFGNATYYGITSNVGTTTTFNVTGLNAGTQYYFSLIPYSSYFSDPSTLNFRTSATIPTTNCTTTVGPEINVRGVVGANPTIADGDTTPQGTDNTLFATVVVGNNQDKVFRIENTGNSNLTVSGISMVGGNSGDFTAYTTAVGTIPFPLTIAAGASYDFLVRFAPLAGGTRNTTLTIANNDSNENPYNFVIQGNGTLVSLVDINVKGNDVSIPDNSIYPSGLNYTAFGLATVGVTTVTRTFTIENLGSTNLSLTGTPYVAITGPHAAMFTVTVQPSSGSIAGGGSLTFDVTFNPSSPGAKNATIVIANNDSDENPYNFNISGNAKGTSNIYVYGNGNDVNKGATTTSITNLTHFGSVAVTTGLKQNTFVISNLSGIATYFSNVTLSGADAAMFSVVSQPTNNSLGSGNSTSFTINFTPTSTGIKNATVSFNVYTNSTRTTADPVDPVYTFAISGEGITYTPCQNNSIQTLAIQDFEDTPATPTYAYTYTTDGNVSIAGGTYNNGSGTRNAFIGAKSFQMAGVGTASSGNLVETAVISMAPLNVSQYSNINLSMKVGAFRTGSQGLDINELVQVETSIDGGVNWSTEAVLRGYSNSRWDFNATGVFNAYYTGTNNGATIDTREGGADLPNGIATYNVRNLPSSANLLIRITLAVDRSDEIWAIDNIRVEGQTRQSTTWNGSNWSAGFPTPSTKAIFDGDYTTTAATDHGSVEACECEVKATRNVIVDSGYYFEIQSDIKNDGFLTIANNANLVQINDSATNTGNITYQRTASGVRGFDYVYWSSPVASQVLNAIYASPTPGFIYRWNPLATNVNSPLSVGNWQSASGPMDLGTGYIMRGSNIYTAPSSNIGASFFGTPNNGVIPVTISRGNNTIPSSPGPGNGVIVTNLDDNWNLVGNPYPSSIRAMSFLTNNTDIQGFVYLWTHGTAPAITQNPFYGTYLYNYTSNDYITHNGTGTTSGPSTFNGYIAGGQGFFVVMNDGATGTGTINFRNSMRNKSFDNSQFYRSAPMGIEDKHRIWLDIVSSSNEVSRTLIGYLPEATLGLDRLYDAIKNTANEFNIYSLAEGQTLTIQGRPSFESTDVVPIGVRIMQDGEYKLAIGAVDGLFLDAEQNIYLEDKILGVTHNLRQNPYTFTATAGTINNRFMLKYETNALGNPDFENLESSVVAAVKNRELTITSYVENIQELTVFDILGRQLFEAKSVENKNFTTSNISISQQTLIVKIKLANGLIVTRKIVL